MGLLEAGGAVARDAHLVALHPQRALERLGDVLVVLDDEDAGCAGRRSFMSSVTVPVYSSVH